MKRIIIITGIIFAGLFSSCQDFADDYFETPAISSGEPSEIFSNATLAKSYVDGIKEPFGQTNSYRGRWLPFYGMNTDVEWHNSSQNDTDATDLCTYDATKTNSQMNTVDGNGVPNNVWALMYVGIERANYGIEGMRKFGNPAPGNDIGYLLGEALTLRAVYYADLLKTWGDVPMRFEPGNSENTYLPKTSRDVIYKQLLKDLEEAATLVPWPNKGETDDIKKASASTERINKTFVKGLRARLALVASGLQQYPLGETDSEIRRSNDPELSVANMYALALKECREIIEGPNPSILEPSFEDIWKKYYSGELYTTGRESLWEIPFSGSRGRMLYTFAVRHNTADQFTGAASQSSVGLLPTVFYDYDPADTRRNVTCVPYRYGNAVNGIAKQELNPINAWAIGKYRYEWTTTRKVGNTTDDGFNKVYMRYAEVFLIAAEAANELEGPAAAAVYLKAVRNRAFRPADRAEKVDAYVASKIGSKEDMLNAIMDEQKYEFAGEMERKQALIRWGKLKFKLDEVKDKMTRLKARTDEYADVPVDLYYKYAGDGTTLDIWGLYNRSEVAPPPAGYILYASSGKGAWNNLNEDKIKSVYRTGVDPDKRQFWPIWEVFINSSNGMLKNDYGY